MRTQVIFQALGSIICSITSFQSNRFQTKTNTMFARNSPSGFLREALLEYSRAKKRNARPSNGQDPLQVDQPPSPTLHRPPLPSSPKGSLHGLSRKESLDIGMSAESVDSDGGNKAVQSSSGVEVFRMDFDVNAKQNGEHLSDPPQPDMFVPVPARNSPPKKRRERLCCKHRGAYKVDAQLKSGDGRAQTTFIQKVFTALFFKALLIILVQLLVETLNEKYPVFCKDMKYHLIPAAVYGVIKVSIRLLHHRGRQCWPLYVVLFILEIVAAGDVLGCLSFFLPSCLYFTPRRVLFCLAVIYAFFLFAGFFVDFDMKDGIMVGTACILVAVLSIHQFFRFKSTKSAGIAQGIDNLNDIIAGFTVLAISEMLVIVIMMELREVLTGQRYDVGQQDWFYTAVYII